jgi:predicted ATPase/DNA-binding CsgD family transcriptional regulator
MSDGVGPRRGEPVGPALNRLVARRGDLDAANRAMSGSRLLTFTGHGGVGKTRLALELAYRTRDRFPDGAWLVRLSDLGIGAEVAEVESAIVSALGISDQSATGPREKLLSYLESRKLLLVLDNCEHVLPSVRMTLMVLLRGARQLHVIATSRESLGIASEVLRPVMPLTVPEPGTPAEQLIMDGSASLLLERACAVDPDFELTEKNAPAVVDLCRALEGLPLAIELAAAKLRALTVEQVVERFGRRLTLLTAAVTPHASRHRSLRTMVDWSYGLCPKNAQVLWRRLSVFSATFDLELAESVCAFGELDSADIMDSIERLVAQSIISTSRGAGVMRYRMPATIREVAADLADQAEETAELRRRHRDAMLQRAQEMLRHWCGPNQDVLIEQMSLDHAGYVAALQWSITTAGEERTALQLLASLRYYFLVGGQLAEGRMRLEATLDAITEPSPVRGECMWVTTWIALLQGDHQRAEQLLDELSVLAEELDDSRLAAHLHHVGALLAMFRGDLDRAIRHFYLAVDEHHAQGDRFLELTARCMVGYSLAYSGHAEEALQLSRETRTLCEQYGERSAQAYAHHGAALAHWTLGRLDEAEQPLRRALQLHRSMGDGVGVALAIALLSWIRYDQNQPGRAAELSAAADHVWRSLGTSLAAFGPYLSRFAEQHGSPESTPSLDDHDHVVRRFQNLDDVIDFALNHGELRGRAGHSDRGPLTGRELEVAALIERGLSNREIAARLFIAKRTADGHVERILGKLGFNSRAQIAAWIARRAS